MTIKELLKSATEQLSKNKHLDSPTLDTEVLLSHILNQPKEHLFVRTHKQVNPKQKQKFLNLVNKRWLGWPVAYLTGQKEFFGLKFYVNRDVMIPRPETETLVEIILDQISSTSFSRSRNLRAAGLKILDIGTGSGCIIISLGKALYQPSSINYQLFASDISAKALAVARKNACLHKVNIQFKHGDLLKPWLARRFSLRSHFGEGGSLGEDGKNQRFDIIIANLPYLAKLEHPSTKFEPKKALIARKQGLALIEKLLKTIARSPAVGGTTKQSKPLTIFVEFDPRQTKRIKKLAAKYLPSYKAKIYKDLPGKNRFALLSQNSLKSF